MTDLDPHAGSRAASGPCSGAVDVVVVCYASRDTIGRCLEHAFDTPNLSRVVVVDHGSDGSGDVAESMGATVIRDPSNPGFGAGQNRGVSHTDAPFVLLLNPDAVIDGRAVKRACEFLETDASIGAVQGRIESLRHGRPERSQGPELNTLHLFGRALGAGGLLTRAWAARLAKAVGVADTVERVPTQPTIVETLAATAMLIRRQAFEEVGGFDRSYFLYGEDLDLCRRLRRVGWRLVALPDLWAQHDDGHSSGTWARREQHWWGGTMLFAGRWWPSRKWQLALAATLLMWLRISAASPLSSGRAWNRMITLPRRARACQQSTATAVPISMSRSKPVVDVVILSWNDGPLLETAVDSVCASGGVDVRIVVIDNGSDPPASVPAGAGIRLVRNERNAGVAPARNQGTRLGIAPFVCFLDSDAVLEPSALRRMVDHLLFRPDAGLVAPVFVDQRPEASAGHAPTLARKLARGLGLTTRYRAVNRGPSDLHWEVDFAIGACQLFRRDAFADVGGLDGRIFYGPEDVDFCLRLRQRGWSVLQAPDVRCIHPPRRRNRALLTRRGLAHGRAVLSHLWRHRKHV